MYVCVSPEDRCDHTQAACIEQCAGMWVGPVADCKCTYRTHSPIHSPPSEPRHSPHTPRETNNNKAGHSAKIHGRWAARTCTHFVWQAVGFYAAAVVGRGGCDEANRAGVGGVLAVARAFEHVTALCLFHWELAMRRAVGGSLAGTVFLFTDWQGGEICDRDDINVSYVCVYEQSRARTHMLSCRTALVDWLTFPRVF